MVKGGCPAAAAVEETGLSDDTHALASGSADGTVIVWLVTLQQEEQPWSLHCQLKASMQTLESSAMLWTLLCNPTTCLHELQKLSQGYSMPVAAAAASFQVLPAVHLGLRVAAAAYLLNVLLCTLNFCQHCLCLLPAGPWCRSYLPDSPAPPRGAAAAAHQYRRRCLHPGQAFQPGAAGGCQQ